MLHLFGNLLNDGEDSTPRAKFMNTGKRLEVALMQLAFEIKDSSSFIEN